MIRSRMTKWPQEVICLAPARRVLGQLAPMKVSSPISLGKLCRKLLEDRPGAMSTFSNAISCETCWVRRKGDIFAPWASEVQGRKENNCSTGDSRPWADPGSMPSLVQNYSIQGARGPVFSVLAGFLPAASSFPEAAKRNPEIGGLPCTGRRVCVTFYL